MVRAASSSPSGPIRPAVCQSTRNPAGPGFKSIPMP